MGAKAPYPGTTIEAVSVIILAGGKSSRFGSDKASALFQGETLLQRTVRRLSPLGVETLVVHDVTPGGPVVTYPPAVREVADVYSGKGPLGGIYTGLRASACFYNLVVGCDMPFLNLDLLRHMISVAGGFDVVMPRVEGKTEALHAIYSKNCLGPIESLIQRNEFQIVRFLGAVKARFIEEKEIDLFDKERLSFFNINSPEDLRYALRVAAQQHDNGR